MHSLCFITDPSTKSPTRFGTTPNHHLWNNHGIWFISYTQYPTPTTKERIRHSLKTNCVETARHRRDLVLQRVANEGRIAVPRLSHESAFRAARPFPRLGSPEKKA